MARSAWKERFAAGIGIPATFIAGELGLSKVKAVDPGEDRYNNNKPPVVATDERASFDEALGGTATAQAASEPTLPTDKATEAPPAAGTEPAGTPPAPEAVPASEPDAEATAGATTPAESNEINFDSMDSFKDQLDHPELLGEELDVVELKLADGTIAKIHIWGDLKALEEAGYTLFKYGANSPSTLQPAFDQFVKGNRFVTGLSYDYATRQATRDSGDVEGITPFSVDLSKGIYIVLTPTLMNEMTRFTATAGTMDPYFSWYVDPIDGSGYQNSGEESGEDRPFVMYFRPGSEFASRSASDPSVYVVSTTFMPFLLIGEGADSEGNPVPGNKLVAKYIAREATASTPQDELYKTNPSATNVFGDVIPTVEPR